MSDLASQSLGYTPSNKVSLWERRAQYESWLASGRMAPKPIPQLHTGVAHTRIDDVEPTKAHKAPEGGTLNPLPPGAIVRTDEGNDNVEPSDDVRLGFAKALLPKIESSDPATAERLANAAHALLGPMVARTDDAKADDENLKNRVTGQGSVKKGSSPGAATAADDEEEKPRKAPDDDDDKGKDAKPTLAKVMAALDGLNKRLDAIEKKPDDDDDDDDDDDGAPAPGAGTPKELAADDADYRSDALRRRTRIERMDKEIHSWRNQDRFAAFQARADQVSQLFGKSASPPMQGESLGAYKRRTVREWQHLSPAFANSDLKVLQVADGVAFNVAINDIMARADAEGRNPSKIPLGYLAERSENKGGHQITKFYGRPITWMAPFMTQGKRVKRIVERSDSGNSRVVYERP